MHRHVLRNLSRVLRAFRKNKFLFAVRCLKSPLRSIIEDAWSGYCDYWLSSRIRFEIPSPWLFNFTAVFFAFDFCDWPCYALPLMHAHMKKKCKIASHSKNILPRKKTRCSDFERIWHHQKIQKSFIIFKSHFLLNWIS